MRSFKLRLKFGVNFTSHPRLLNSVIWPAVLEIQGQILH